MRQRLPGKLIAGLSLISTITGCGLFGEVPSSSHAIRSVTSKPGGNRPSYGETYVVARGDTLFSIAFRNQLDYHELASWNGIGRDYGIKAGQVLRLTPPTTAGLLPPADDDVAASSANGAAVPAGRSSRSPTAPSEVVILALPRQGSSSSDTPRSSPSARASVATAQGAGGWEWPTRGKLLRSYDGSSNKGLDIGGDVGQIVIASRGGKVVYSGSALKGYGELIIVKHDEDTLSAYGYNRKRLVEEGETVVGGQPIAELGLGPEQRPLLHFEIRDHGKPVDPKPLLPSR